MMLGGKDASVPRKVVDRGQVGWGFFATRSFVPETAPTEAIANRSQLARCSFALSKARIAVIGDKAMSVVASRAHKAGLAQPFAVELFTPSIDLADDVQTPRRLRFGA